MAETKQINWSVVVICVGFFLLAGFGAGMSVQNYLLAMGGWRLPVYGIVSGIFSAFAGVLLVTVLQSFRED